MSYEHKRVQKNLGRREKTKMLLAKKPTSSILLSRIT